MKFRNLIWVAVFLAGIPAASRAALIPAAPPPGFTLQSINNQVDPSIKLKINAYTSPIVNFKQDVICPETNVKIGTLEFDYTTYTGDFTGGNANTFGGALINGGFKAIAGACPLPPGATYRWLQQVIVTGDQNQNIIDGNPFYPNFTQAGFDAVLFDAPGRGTLGAVGVQNLSWLAESALVCVVGNTVKALGSFLWGFDIKTVAGVTTVNPNAPHLWGPTTASFKAKFKADYPAYSIEDGCCCVPEPSTMVLTLIGLVVPGGIRLRAWRAARRQAA